MNRLHISLRSKKILGCFCMSMLLFSCKKFVTVGPDPGTINTQLSFSDSVNANTAMIGMYINIIGTGNGFNTLNGSTGLYAGCAADEIDAVSVSAAGKEFFNNAVLNTSTTNEALWTNGYQYIYHANACIEGASASTGLSAAMKNKIVGEALFMRSYIHFTLMNLFGRIPLITGTDYRLNATVPRIDTAVIYGQLVSDLEKAYELLQTDPMPIVKNRPNKYTVKALLSRVYLYRKQWAQAEAAADIVLGSSCRLVSNIDSAFLTNNREAIFQIPASFPATETPEGNTYNPAVYNGVITSNPTYIATTPLITSFENGDKRKLQWLRTVTVGAGNYTYPFKYKERHPTSGGTSVNPKEAHTPFRLAEQFLIRAEARAQQNKLDDARKDLDTIRTRAGLGKTTLTAKDDIIDAVLKERRVELFSEWGHRFFDLKRTGKIDAVMTAVKPTTWKSTAALFPIPYNQTLLNPFLEPNP